MTVTIGYLRVSTDEQQLGPEAQRCQILAWAAREGREITAWFADEGVSGAAPLDARPGLLRALDTLTRGSEMVVAKRDRLARDVFMNAMIQHLVDKAGATIISADGAGNGNGPEARLMAQILAAFSEFERQLIRARTKAAMAVKRERGEYLGSLPYGWALAEDGRMLVENPEEQATISLILKLRREKGLSCRKLAEHLNAVGVPSRGTRWQKTTIERILKKEKERTP